LAHEKSSHTEKETGKGGPIMKLAIMLLISTLMAQPSIFLAQPMVRNPRIDDAGFLDVTKEALMPRKSRRLNENDVRGISGEAGTIVPDARSSENIANCMLPARKT
jgi:hypothetical protein